jgi:hypothetical protein
MKYLSIILISISLFSCSASKRVSRILKNNPELIKRDTITHYDTIRLTTNRVEIDTVTSLQSMTKDTLILTRENVTVKTIYSHRTDSLYIYVEKEPETLDTALVTATIVNSVSVKPIETWKKWIGWLVVLLLSIIGIGLLLKILPLIRKLLGF